jgi:osmoprotectant transport system substrate-binding protein
MTRMVALLLAVASLAVGAVACGSGGSGGKASDARPQVTLGTKNFTEQYVLGQLYAQALRAKGYKVEVKENIGSSEIADKALTSGSIDLYPEYTGTSLSVAAGETMAPRSAQETYRKAKAFYAKRGQTLLEATPFEDRDAVAVTKAFARKHDLESMGDLRRLRSFTLGAAPEFRTRSAGLQGLREDYGLDNVKFVPLEIEAGANYEALDSGQVDAADVFTTDAQLASGKYVVLKDPAAVFGFQNLAPVVDSEVLREQGAGFAETLDAVSGKLTNEVMQHMNADVAIDGKEPADVAREFLQRNSLL